MVPVLLAGALVATCTVLQTDPTTGAVELPVPGDRIPGEVEVLNGSGVDGLARTVTRKLRFGGIDVVYFGNNSELVDSTFIIARRGDTAFASTVMSLLGAGELTIAPDSDLYVDVSVILGRDFSLETMALPD